MSASSVCAWPATSSVTYDVHLAGNEDRTQRILCEDPDTRRARGTLTAAVQATLATGLGLLGLAAPDRM